MKVCAKLKLNGFSNDSNDYRVDFSLNFYDGEVIKISTAPKFKTIYAAKAAWEKIKTVFAETEMLPDLTAL